MASQPIQLSDHFTYPRLLRFVAPSIIMMLFTSTYTIVDGFFVSNYAGADALAAVNLVYPIVFAVGALGFMFGSGGSALVAKMLGEGHEVRARGIFSFIVIAAAVVGTLTAVGGIFVLDPFMALLGADAGLIELCRVYGVIVMAAVPAFILQNVFQSFFVAAGKPKVGLAVTVAAGVTNIVGDALLVGVFGMGIVGAAVATAASQVIGAVCALVYFVRPRADALHMAKPICDFKALGKAAVNGSSELMSNVASSVVSTLYNYQLLAYAGTQGVAAYSAIMYVAFVFSSMLFGYAMGSAPLVSYHYGARNKPELQNLFGKSVRLLAGTGVVMFAAAELLARPLAWIFVGYDDALLEMTVHGFAVYSFVYLIMGLCVYASSFFTALNNGLVSAVISFMRTLVFETAAVMLLPMVLGLDGVWLSAIVAELCAFVLSFAFLLGLRKEYGYWLPRSA